MANVWQNRCRHRIQILLTNCDVRCREAAEGKTETSNREISPLLPRNVVMSDPTSRDSLRTVKNEIHYLFLPSAVRITSPKDQMMVQTPDQIPENEATAFKNQRPCLSSRRELKRNVYPSSSSLYFDKLSKRFSQRDRIPCRRPPPRTPLSSLPSWRPEQRRPGRQQQLRRRTCSDRRDTPSVSRPP